MSEGGYRIELPVFEGPLDLLLHLVKKHELDVFDIPVSFVTEKYLEHLNLMRSLNLDIVGEFLLMAATLMHIKSRELLPPDPSQEDEAEDDTEDACRCEPSRGVDVPRDQQHVPGDADDEDLEHDFEEGDRLRLYQPIAAFPLAEVGQCCLADAYARAGPHQH